MTAKVMGVDHAVLVDKFTSLSSRPKKYREITSEEYAFTRFQQEVFKWQDYLRKTGIFFSFSTDPLCADTFSLTWQCVRYATKEYGIPVKILTKNADFSAQQMLWLDMARFGFTDSDEKGWQKVYWFGMDMKLLYRYDKRQSTGRFRFKTDYRKSYVSISCHHFHQLQVIMRYLTGGELEFEYRPKE